MDKASLLLSEKILKHTSGFRLGQFKYEKTGESIRVWGNSNVGDTFHSTEIIQLFTQLFDTYITYDSQKNKCVLVIF